MTKKGEKAGRGMFLGFTLLDSDTALIERMPKHRREVLQGTQTYSKQAAALKIPIGTFRSRLSRARMALVKARAAWSDAP